MPWYANMSKNYINHQHYIYLNQIDIMLMINDDLRLPKNFSNEVKAVRNLFTCNKLLYCQSSNRVLYYKTIG